MHLIIASITIIIGFILIKLHSNLTNKTINCTNGNTQLLLNMILIIAYVFIIISILFIIYHLKRTELKDKNLFPFVVFLLVSGLLLTTIASVIYSNCNETKTDIFNVILLGIFIVISCSVIIGYKYKNKLYRNMEFRF